MKLAILVPAVLAALAVAVPAAASHETDVGEAKLAKILAGRTAGKPVQCLSASQRRHMEAVEHTALVFRDGDTLYVNRPSGVNLLTWSDVPVFKLSGDQLCSKDIVQLRDSGTRMPSGSMVMNEFIPYRRNG